MKFKTRWIIKFESDTVQVIHYTDKNDRERTVKHTYHAGAEIPVNLRECETLPETGIVDIVLASGNMLRHVPVNLFVIVLQV